jgi:hypothetical protein
VDVTIKDVSATVTATGYGFTLIYDAPEISVTADLTGEGPGEGELDGGWLASAEGSSLFVVNDPLTDDDGTYLAAAFDTGPEVTSEESGDGVLQRLTLTVSNGAADGGYPLHLLAAGYVDRFNGSHAPDTTFSAQIAVGVTCLSLPPVEPPPGIMGDVDCSGGVNAVDALKVLRSNAALSVAQTPPCNIIGNLLPHVGDVDCSGGVNAIDALKILRHNAGLSVLQIGPEPDACPNIET